MDPKQPQLSPEAIQELEKISRESIFDPIPTEPEIPFAPMAIRIPPVIGMLPKPLGVKDIKNSCAQAAVTSLTEHHNKNPFLKKADPLQELLDYTYKWYPPDIFHGTFGTSVNRMNSALKEYGFRHTLSFRLEPWLSFGFTNPLNRVAYGTYSKMIFSYVNAGYPAIVMVDNSMLGDDVGMHHWAILFAATNGVAHICNATSKAKRTYHLAQFNLTKFAYAWEAPYLALPGFRFNAVIPIP